jgi:hypothetical protein
VPEGVSDWAGGGDAHAQGEGDEVFGWCELPQLQLDVGSLAFVEGDDGMPFGWVEVAEWMADPIGLELIADTSSEVLRYQGVAAQADTGERRGDVDTCWAGS